MKTLYCKKTPYNNNTPYCQKTFYRQKLRSSFNQKGQVVVEYVLLLIISVALASLVVAQVAKRDPNNPGLVVSQWNKILQYIGSDLPEK